MQLLQKPQLKLLKPDLALALTWWSVSFPSSKQTVVGNTTMNPQKFDDGWKIVSYQYGRDELRALFSAAFLTIQPAATALGISTAPGTPSLSSTTSRHTAPEGFCKRTDLTHVFENASKRGAAQSHSN